MSALRCGPRTAITTMARNWGSVTSPSTAASERAVKPTKARLASRSAWTASIEDGCIVTSWHRVLLGQPLVDLGCGGGEAVGLLAGGAGHHRHGDRVIVPGHDAQHAAAVHPALQDPDVI